MGGGAGGYYTKAQYSDLVSYAASRQITIVPEIDMPGHVNAALASYAQLNCNNTAPPLYTVIDATNTLHQFSKVADYEKPFDIAPGIRATFFNAGHILGSASVLL